MKVDFEVLAGPLKGQCFSFSEYSRISVGRSEQAFFSFPKDKKLSRVHCLIELAPPQECFLQDLGSLNGTFVIPVGALSTADFRKVTQTKVQNGESIKIGETIFRINISTETNPDNSTNNSNDNSINNSTKTSPPREESPEQEQLEGRTIGPFQIDKKLGEGGMGVVYLVRHIETNYEYAFKIARPQMTPHENQIKRFLREASYGSKVKHINIVRHYPAGYSQGNFFYIPMEYVPGLDFKNFLIRLKRPLTLQESFQFFFPILDGLECLHQNKIIHRDIKPANILLTKQNNQWVVKISDFGLAKNLEETGLSGLTMSNCAMGTPDYLPPEQCSNAKKADYRSDIYSLGATFYNLLTRCKIYKPSNSHIYTKIMVESPIDLKEANPNIPSSISEVIMKCLEKDSENRYQSTTEFKEAMRQAFTKMV